MPAADAFWVRYVDRIARIHTLSRYIGRPLSYEYLQSCDVRSLPVLLEDLEARLRRGRRRWPWPRR
jgi:hypothetical protein